MQKQFSKTRSRLRIRKAALFCCFLFLCSLFPLPASATPMAPDLPDTSRVKSYILYNLEFNTVLSEKNADVSMFPASTVKIMTGLLTSELLSERMDETVTVTAEMLKGVTGNRMSLTAGEEIKLRDLYYGAICGCYNDACTALAVIAAGSTENFVTLMNEKAAVLGMTGTIYENPTGLHSSAMVTTARDTLVLSLAANENDLLMAATSAVKHEIPATNTRDARTFYNRNYLIASAVTTEYHNPYVAGLNAGMTDEGGWCLSARADRNDLTWFCVILGGEEDAENGTIYSYLTANKLLSWAARGYEVRTLVKEGKKMATTAVNYAAIGEDLDDGLPLVTANDLTVFVPKNTAANEVGLEYTVRLHASALDAPFPEGTEAGALIAMWNGEEVGRVALLTERGVQRNHFTFFLAKMRALPKNRIVIFSLVFFVLLTTVYFLFFAHLRPHRRHTHGSYVPLPFRKAAEEERSSASAEKRAQNGDPYASAAREMEQKKNKK